MNIYVLIEGERGAKDVYKTWIPFTNPELTYAPEIHNVTTNCYYIEAGYGYPEYFERIRAAIETVATVQVNGNRVFDRLVVAIDSEDMDEASKTAEVVREMSPTIRRFHNALDYKIVIQHSCFEAWALGNRKLVGGNPSRRLIEYRQRYNVIREDPELLPDYPEEELNRAQFAFKYLKASLSAKHNRLTYSKNDTEVVCNESYFTQLKGRLRDTGHIRSFETFLTAFT